MNDYRATIGIECHVQLKTRTKLFAAVGNDARDAAPNSLISHICVGLPGALPVLNERAIELAIRAAFALNTTPQPFSYFERKHYFYPDLPKGYQISQLTQPIIIGGSVTITVDGQQKTVHITRAQLEEDAGKNMHPEGADYSLVDLNRAGTPLLEIVSEPDMHSPAEAKAYVRELYLLMKYADVSDVDLYHGNMRFDVNVSLSNTDKLGVRTEVKNLNSFRSVEKATEYEIKRQTELLKKGERVIQETRGWDEARQRTFAQRSKEDAHDYRYMPEPDVPPVVLGAAAIAAVKTTLPELPSDLRARFSAIGLTQAQIETILEEPEAAAILRIIHEAHDRKTARTIANWLTGELLRLVSTGEVAWAQVAQTQAQLVGLAGMLDNGSLSSSAAKEILLDVVKTGDSPEAVATLKNLLQVSDETALQALVDEVLAANQAAVQDVQAGQAKAIGFLVGQVMKASQGKANPGLVQTMIKKRLGLN